MSKAIEKAPEKEREAAPAKQKVVAQANPVAQISFGIRIPKGFLFPWDEVKSEDESKARPGLDPEDWWLGQNKYKTPHRIWDKDGQKVEGASDADVDECHDHRVAFLEKLPFPAVLVELESGKGKRFILAAVGSIHSTEDGEDGTMELQFGEIVEECTEQSKADLAYLIKQSLLTLSQEQGLSLEQPGWILSTYTK